MMESSTSQPDIRLKTQPCDVLWDISNLEMDCKRYMARNRPVLLKGAAREWEACRKWSLAFFRDGGLGSTMVDVSLDGCEAGRKQRQSLRDYITGFTSGQFTSAEANDKFPPYMRAWHFPDDEGGSDLLKDFPNPPPYFPDKFKRLEPQFQPPFTWLFIGPKGAYSPLHRDIWFTCAWMAQIEGQKRFIFFSPSDLKHVYKKENGREEYIDLSAASTPQALACCSCISSRLTAECSKWAHYVESLTPSVSLTSNFANHINFKHVLVPYTKWLERRRMVMAMMGAMKSKGSQLPGTSAGPAGQADEVEEGDPQGDAEVEPAVGAMDSVAQQGNDED